MACASQAVPASITEIMTERIFRGRGLVYPCIYMV